MFEMNRWQGVRRVGFPNRVGRREFLLTALASGGLAASCVSGQASLLSLPNSGWGKVLSQAAVEPLVTSNPEFFVRNHFETPRISEEEWSLEVSGMVSKPLNISYSDLLLTPSVSRPSTLECAGNPSGGAGASTAVWSGVSLSNLLKQAGPAAGATTVVFHGADSGIVDDSPTSTHFARAISLDRAMDSTTMLAYEMNGEPLPPDHGFPLRAMVPGWYGMDSVKWLTRIEILDKPFMGYFQQQQYVSVKANGERSAITSMRVNSKVLRPSQGEEIRQKSYRVEGVAWAGEHQIVKVELRTDPGGVWQATLLASTPALVWTPWSYDWRIPAPGQYTLEVRATDEVGHTQPEVRDPDRKDIYELNTSQRVTVSMRL